jgi:hypothetical protein
MKSLRILPAAVLLCALTAACGETPTGPQAQPGGASYDGGYTIGSGNSVMQAGGGFTIGSGRESDPADDPTLTTTSETGDDPGRGGYTIGSGN